MKNKRILYVSSELTPYLPSSHMADTSLDLPKLMQEEGCDVRIFMPRFGCINERRHQLHEVIRLSGMNMVVNDIDQPLIIKVASVPRERLQVYFIDNQEYFKTRCREYDENGMITKYSSSNTYDQEDEDCITYQYDEKGNIIEKIVPDVNGRAMKYMKYDEDGYIVSTEILCGLYVADYTLLLFTYNEQHKPKQIIDNGSYTATYQYENNLISKVTVKDGPDFSIKYDENGNLVEMTNSLDKGFKMSIQYKPYYVDKEYFDYYLSCYYYRYLDTPLEQSLFYEIPLYITEINQDVLQGKLRSSFCDLPYIAPEDVYVGNPFKVDNK